MRTHEIEADLAEDERLLGIVVASDKGARVVWTPLMLALPRELRVQIGAMLNDAADMVPPAQTN